MVLEMYQQLHPRNQTGASQTQGFPVIYTICIKKMSLHNTSQRWLLKVLPSFLPSRQAPPSQFFANVVVLKRVVNNLKYFVYP